ncbi:hypothetical protein MASR2M8_22060 [Opitutaceae bacterium]
MDNAAPVLIALMIGGTITAFILWAGARSTAKSRRNGEALAARLGLTLEPGKPKLGLFHPAPRASGVIRGKRVAFFTFATGSGKSRVVWAAITIIPPNAGGLTFNIDRQGLLTKLIELFGMKEIQIGDPDFDAKWFIQTNQPDFFRAAFLPELRTKLTELSNRGRLRGAITLKDGVVMYRERGSFYNEAQCDRMAGVVDLACDLADVAEVWAGSAK